MPTGQMGYDPDDFADDRRQDRERQREQDRADRQRMREQQRQEQERRDREQDERERMEAIRMIVNDDAITISPEERKIINDPMQRMMSNGEIVRRSQTRTGSAFANQFRLDKIIPKVKKKARKKARKELDRLQSEAFREANRLLRTKTGKLRKGVSQSDIAKRAQKILKRLRK